MFSLFKRRSQEIIPAKEPGMLYRLQERLCRQLQDKCNRMGKPWTYGIVLVILALFALLSGQSLWHAITEKTGPGVRISPIKLPVSVGKADTTLFNAQQHSEDLQREQLEVYRQYFDSIRFTDRATYDSMLLVRPGLLDTVQLLERILNR